MAIIANLDILLGARTDGLDAGLTRSRGRVRDFERNVSGIGAAATAALSPIRELGRDLSTMIPGSIAATNAVTALTTAFTAMQQTRAAATTTRSVDYSGGLGISSFTKTAKSAQDAASSLRTGISAIGPAGIAAGAAVGAAFVGAGIAIAAIVKTIAGVRAQLGAVDEIAKAAGKANVTFRELAGFRLSVGESTGLGPEAADKALTKLQIRLGEAKRNGGALADQLKSLGLDAGQLLESGPVSAMKQLATATQQMKSPADQLGLAFKLFEEEGSALVSTLRGGPEAIAAATTAAENLGLTLSQTQAKQVEAANDAWGRVQLIATGVFRQIAAEVAPLITAIADAIDDTAEGFRGWEEPLPEIIDSLVLATGITKDFLELSTAAYDVLFRIANLNFTGALNKFNEALDVGSGFRMLDRVNQARMDAENAASAPTTGITDLSAIEAEAEAQRTAAESAKRAAEERERAAQQNREAITSRLSGLRDEVATLRQGADAVDRMRLARQGATAAQLASFDAITREKKEIENLQEAMERGAALRAQFATPAQKLQKEMTDLRQLLSVGAIDFGTFAQAARDAAGRLGKQEDKQRSDPAPSFGALQKGSVEAFSAALRNEKAGGQQRLQAEGNKLLAAINTSIAQLAQQRGITIGAAG